MGAEQVFAYRAVLDKALLTIQQNPDIGQPRKELSPAHRIFPAGQHIIVYRATEHAVYVSRILHGRMDISRHLSAKPAAKNGQEAIARKTPQPEG